MIRQSQSEVGVYTNHPTSYLFAKKNALKIDRKGRLLEPEALLTFGIWAEEGVADLLPFDYANPTSSLSTSQLSKQRIPKKKGFILSKLLIPVEEIKNGGPPRDGIPSIDHPKFVKARTVNYLKPEEKVLGIIFNGVTKAYPIKIMDRHEIVNDDFGGIPVAVTFCPLCASGVGVLAKVDGRQRTFGVSGLLYNSDVLLYDRETESLWSQIMGQAISGPTSGTELEIVPTVFTTWSQWQREHPKTLVLSKHTGFAFDYEETAYIEYLSSQRLMFPVKATSNQLKNKDKVLGIEIDGASKAYPLKRLRKSDKPLRDEFNGRTIVIRYDRESHTAWAEDVTGEVLPGITLFWFAWYAFHPDTEVYQ